MKDTTIIGRLTQKPELAEANGKKYSKLNLAVNTVYPGKDGKVKTTDFFSVTCWGKVAETVARHLGKGRLVLVKGTLHQRKWLDADGKKRQGIEISGDKVQFLDRGKTENIE